MRILILGNNYSARSFLELFLQDKENIVFSTIQDTQSFVNFENIEDIVEFVLVNDINFVLIVDEEYINQGLQEILSSHNIYAFAPSIEAISICTSKAYAKKFMYKNKIQTPKFQVIEKPQLALDYIKANKQAHAIKPDNHNNNECTLFAETFSNAQKIINNLFNQGNKKIIIEDYIEGKQFSVWTISDGFNAKIIGTSAKYQNNLAYFNPDFATEELKNKIQEEIINPTINALNSQEEEYIGVLGFDCILTYDNELFLLGYNSFFDEINVDFYTKGYELNWIEIFDSIIAGDVFLKYDFKNHQRFMVTLRQEDEIKFVCANTKTNLNRYLNELDFDLNELNEAQLIWKY